MTTSGSKTSGRRTGGRRGPRRQSIWQGSNGSAENVALGTRNVFALVDVNANATFVDGTAVRIRGMWSARTDVATSLASGRVFAGAMVVTLDAFNIGITALPIPSVDTAADWMYWTGLPLIGDGGSSLNDLKYIPVDNRAMRKLPGVNKVLALILENQTGVAVDFSFAMRTLVKLH